MTEAGSERSLSLFRGLDGVRFFGPVAFASFNPLPLEVSFRSFRRNDGKRWWLYLMFLSTSNCLFGLWCGSISACLSAHLVSSSRLAFFSLFFSSKFRLINANSNDDVRVEFVNDFIN
jgi:hypothetical protein